VFLPVAGLDAGGVGTVGWWDVRGTGRSKHEIAASPIRISEVLIFLSIYCGGIDSFRLFSTNLVSILAIGSVRLIILGSPFPAILYLLQGCIIHVKLFACKLHFLRIVNSLALVARRLLIFLEFAFAQGSSGAGHTDNASERGIEDSTGIVNIEFGVFGFGVGIRIVLDERLHRALEYIIATHLKLPQFLLADPHTVDLFREGVEVGLDVLLDELVLGLQDAGELVAELSSKYKYCTVAPEQGWKVFDCPVANTRVTRNQWFHFALVVLFEVDLLALLA
jgi:hypothetical protein